MYGLLNNTQYQSYATHRNTSSTNVLIIRQLSKTEYYLVYLEFNTKQYFTEKTREITQQCVLRQRPKKLEQHLFLPLDIEAFPNIIQTAAYRGL